MANIQKQFEQFHGTIRADYEHNATLREKRDIIVKRVQAHLTENKHPGCSGLNQGSYAMGTGVKTDPYPALEPDIDVGLRFDFTETEYPATTVRQWVRDAVKDHTNKVIDKGPCIRVVYEAGYHVDLVCYAVWNDIGGKTQYRLAHKTRGWIAADPPALLEHVRIKRKPFEGSDDGSKTDQFRRVVRYLKRWNDEAISKEREDKPTGLAFTLLCCESLRKSVTWDGTLDDRTALYDLARGAADRWGRIMANKPTPEYEDMFARLSDDQMTELKNRFAALADALKVAKDDPDIHSACKGMQKVFGSDFPVPDKTETAKVGSGPAIISSTSAA